MPREIDVSLSRLVPAAVIRSGVQRVFVNRLKRAKEHARHVVIVSPWITAVGGPSCPFSALVQVIQKWRGPAYFFTRPPESVEHLKATQLLRACPTVELVYNDNIHAKVYACTGPSPHGFALLGSANLTANSLNLYEIGLLIIGVGPGSSIVDELANFGLHHLRTRPESDVVKKNRHKEPAQCHLATPPSRTITF
jgi:hypothetical protein